MNRKFTDIELLNKVKGLASFKEIPKDFWILGVRSKADESDVYDDKFYLFENEMFIMVTTGTTNPGANPLLSPSNPEGVAIVKSDEWYYNLWQFGQHKGKMDALKQVNDIKFYRDNNKNAKSEEIGQVNVGIIGINFHTCSYSTDAELIKSYTGSKIGLWSEGCQVCNDLNDYYHIIAKCKLQKFVSYCLINEF